MEAACPPHIQEILRKLRATASAGYKLIKRKTWSLGPSIGRDSEYKRHGTRSLLAGIDLVSGEVIGSVEERHRSREFVEFLKKLDTHYSPELRIKIILDNHSAHISKETKAYLCS
jgi:hypothetical protein